MRKKVTITIDETVYQGLTETIGRRNISQFLESLLHSHVVDQKLESAYKTMSEDEIRETEALEWAEATSGDVSNETR